MADLGEADLELLQGLAISGKLPFRSHIVS